ncbi:MULTISPECIES: hypothetical protein [Deinococcus]|nr:MULTISPECIES: hypothetical protein [Deinococcus]
MNSKLLLLTAAFVGSASAAAPTSISDRTFSHTCTGAKKISVCSIRGAP